MSKASLSLDAENISLVRGEHKILRNVTFTLKPGELTAIIGPNGAGKSTLLRVMASLTKGLSGSVRLGAIGSMESLSAATRARYIGWVGDQSHLPFPFTVFDTVRLGRYHWHKGVPTPKDNVATELALHQLGIAHLALREVTSLSSGERQKTMIARLLAGETPIMLLDEPLANLDIGSSLKLLGLLRKKAEEGATLCLSIHDLPLAYRFADRVLCLTEGALIGDGPAKDVLVSPQVKKAFGIASTVAPGLFLTTGE